MIFSFNFCNASKIYGDFILICNEQNVNWKIYAFSTSDIQPIPVIAVNLRTDWFLQRFVQMLLLHSAPVSPPSPSLCSCTVL